MADEYWRKIDRGAFPGSSSNHHLRTLAQMGILTLEMMEFDEQYADAVIQNSKTLAAALDKCGFDVEAKEYGYTESHQVAVNMERFGGGGKVSINLEVNDIILNMNMLPHEPLTSPDHPVGVRLGVQEMARFGMDENEMEGIAELIKAVVMDEKDVKEKVHQFRSGFQDVRYSFDDATSRPSADSKNMG